MGPDERMALLSAVEQAGLGLVRGMQLIARSGRSIVYRLQIDKGAWMLKIPLGYWGWDPLCNERAALEILAFEGIRCASEARLLHLPRPALLTTEVSGQAGNDPHAAGVAAGETVCALAEIRFASFGSRGTTRGFVPARGSWKQEWSAFHHNWWGRISPVDVLGDLASQLHNKTLQELDVLDTATDWCLVHRDLHPGNLVFDNGVVGILDWGSAIVGDPLVDWVQPVQVGGDYLRGFLQAVGSDALEEVISGPGLARLTVYVQTRCLARIAQASQMGATRGALALEVARVQHLDVGEQLSLCQPPTIPSAREVLSRRALERLRCSPMPTDLDVNTAVFACVAEVDAQGADLVAGLVEQLGTSSGAFVVEPIEAPEPWIQALRQRAAGQTTGVAAFVAVALELVLELDAAVSASVLRTLEAHLEEGLARPRTRVGLLQVNEVLAQGLLSLRAGIQWDPSTARAVLDEVRFAQGTATLPAAWSEVPKSPEQAARGVAWFLLVRLQRLGVAVEPIWGAIKYAE